MLEFKDGTKIDCEVETIAAKNPQVVVFTIPRVMSTEAKMCLREGWQKAVAGTSLEHVKAVILEGGVTLSIVDEVE